jgi:hypothetical protein
MAGFIDALWPDKFTGVHFKRWQYKAEHHNESVPD